MSAEQTGEALDYLLEWFLDEIIGNETRLIGFDPPALVVDRVCEGMVRKHGWPDVESACEFLAEELWPDCVAIRPLPPPDAPRVA
jgi:hypothetical protein